MSQELQALRRHLDAANAIVSRLLKKDKADGAARNPAHFRSTGHLSDAGIEAIYKLFDAGETIEGAAAKMGISIRGAASRKRAWQNR